MDNYQYYFAFHNAFWDKIQTIQRGSTPGPKSRDLKCAGILLYKDTQKRENAPPPLSKMYRCSFFI